MNEKLKGILLMLPLIIALSVVGIIGFGFVNFILGLGTIIGVFGLGTLFAWGVITLENSL